MYIFALSILEGTDLINLFPSKLSLKQPGFYWFYQLRGNDVIYNAFHDLSKVPGDLTFEVKILKNIF